MIVRRSWWLSPPCRGRPHAGRSYHSCLRRATDQPSAAGTRGQAARGYLPRLTESLPSTVGRAARKEVGVQDLAQDRHPVNDARTMAAEIPSPVGGVDLCLLDRRQALPLGETGEWLRVVNRSRQVEATGHEHEHVRPISRDIIPRDLVREATVATEVVLPAGDPNHLWNPVTGGVRRVQPLHGERAGASI